MLLFISESNMGIVDFFRFMKSSDNMINRLVFIGKVLHVFYVYILFHMIKLSLYLLAELPKA